MRGFASISALALVGCSFSASIEPPNTNGLDAQGIDAKLDGPPDDVDADGVKNTVDNCPMIANTQQFNEDNDSRGDECDPCPHLGAPADDLDDDGDKVGNGCDPRRTTPGDAIAYWNGFHVPGPLPVGITMIHGAADRWTVVGGHLVFTRNVDDWGMPAVDVGKTVHTTESMFEILTSYAGASAAGVAVDIAANDTDLFECQARTDTPGAREMWRRDPLAFDGWTGLASTMATTPDDIYRITLHRAANVACTTTRAGQVSVSMNETVGPLGNTRAGLFARNVDARFRYLVVYTSN